MQLVVALCKVPLPQWVTLPNCLLPFPVLFDLRHEEKASNQGFWRIILLSELAPSPRKCINSIFLPWLKAARTELGLNGSA